jgi:hypothetical protein
MNRDELRPGMMFWSINDQMWLVVAVEIDDSAVVPNTQNDPAMVSVTYLITDPVGNYVERVYGRADVFAWWKENLITDGLT